MPRPSTLGRTARGSARLRELGRQELQRHLAAEADVLRAVDRSHAASPEQLLQTEAGDLAPGEWILPDRQTRSFPAPSKENTTVTEALRLGDYSLELELGRGAVGVVHRGRSADGRVVAIKTFDRALADDETFRARLAHEAARGARDPGSAPRPDPRGRRGGRPALSRARVPAGRLSRGEARGWAASSRGDAACRGRGGGRPRRPSSGRHRPPGRQAVERHAPSRTARRRSRTSASRRGRRTRC